MKTSHGASGTESVWDYPRPPRLEPASQSIKVVHRGEVIAETTSALRVLETSHPPTYYIPPGDVRMDLLVPNAYQTMCEWKGAASYYDLVLGGTTVRNAAWTYRTPNPEFRNLAHHLAFYAQKVDECYVGHEKVDAQAGSFYGGWITSRITGPFKGAAGTAGW